MPLQPIEANITGQEAAEIILENALSVLKTSPYPYQNVDNFDLYPVKKIRLYGSKQAGAVCFVRYFFNRENAGYIRSNLQLELRDAANVLLYSIVPQSGFNDALTTADTGLISFPLMATKSGDPIHGTIVGEATIDLTLANYNHTDGYGMYNSDTNANGWTISPLCWDNIEQTGANVNGAASSARVNALSVGAANALRIDNSPFTVAPEIGNMGNAVLNVEVYPRVLGVYDDYALLYLWRNSAANGGAWEIRIAGKNVADSGWTNLGDWNKPTYTPAFDIETIQVNAGCFVTIDWSKVPDNSTDNKGYILKKSCIRLDNGNTDWVLQPNSAPQFLVDAVRAANALTPSFEAYTQNKYALAFIFRNVEVTPGNTISLIRFGRMIDNAGYNNNYVAMQWSETQIDEVKTYQLAEIKITIDWSKIPNGTNWSGAAWIKNILFAQSGGLVPEGYSARDTTEVLVTVKKDGTGDFTSIGAAYAAITDSTFNRQYEVCVYPGEYLENNLFPPPFTHTHGLAPNTVIVSSRLEQLLNTWPVFDQKNGTSKLSNMTIESWTGYCIHFDIGLNKQTIFNENLHLRKIDYPGVISNAIIGGGSFMYGTKYVWKSCTFEDGQALCHTNGNALNENVHLIFQDCRFINAWAGAGSVGGFGHCVVELQGCKFTRGKNSFISWNSPIRNLPDPTLYLFNTVEWQVIGGGNENFAPSMPSAGKTLIFEATTAIQVSGSAAPIIFGSMPTYRAKGVRFDAAIISMYNIQDVKAGMVGYSARVDVFQLWKRLGDCSTVNKTLTVTAQGTTKTYTFNQDYLTLKTSQASIVAAMQAVLTNVVISPIDAPVYEYRQINTTDKVNVTVTAPDILRREFVTRSGGLAIDTTPLDQVLGVAVDDGVNGGKLPVWTGCFAPDYPPADGDYGLTNTGALTTGATVKIGTVLGGFFYPKY